MRNRALTTAVTLAVAPLAVIAVGPAAADATTTKRGYTLTSYEDGSGIVGRYEHGRLQPRVAKLPEDFLPVDLDFMFGNAQAPTQPRWCRDFLIRQQQATIIACSDGRFGWRKPTPTDLRTLPRF